jgi:hypothetical protein
MLMQQLLPPPPALLLRAASDAVVNKRDRQEAGETDAVTPPVEAESSQQGKRAATDVSHTISVISSSPYVPKSVRFQLVIVYIMLFIVMCKLPISLVENRAFIALVCFLDVRMTGVLPGRTFFWSRIDNMFNAGRAQLRSRLQLVRWVSLTCDCWTSSTNDSYVTRMTRRTPTAELLALPYLFYLWSWASWEPCE